MDKKILVIEDEVDIKDAIAEAIAEDGYPVLTAENGQIGLAIALEEHPDLILLDIHMPVMDGHEALRRLRQDPWGKHAKVVILSAMDDVQNIGSAFEGTITDYIIKSHNSLDEIMAKVKMAL